MYVAEKAAVGLSGFYGCVHSPGEVSIDGFGDVEIELMILLCGYMCEAGAKRVLDRAVGYHLQRLADGMKAK